MKKKDIILVVVSVLAIGVSIYFMIKMLNPAPKTAVVDATQNQEQKFTGNIDEDTLESLKKLNDYGEATLENIGRVNPFGPLN